MGRFAVVFTNSVDSWDRRFATITTDSMSEAIHSARNMIRDRDDLNSFQIVSVKKIVRRDYRKYHIYVELDDGYLVDSDSRELVDCDFPKFKSEDDAISFLEAHKIHATLCDSRGLPRTTDFDN